MLFKFANWVESVVKGISLKKRVIFSLSIFAFAMFLGVVDSFLSLLGIFSVIPKNFVQSSDSLNSFLNELLLSLFITNVILYGDFFVNYFDLLKKEKEEILRSRGLKRIPKG